MEKDVAEKDYEEGFIFNNVNIAVDRLKIMYTNADCLHNKRDELECMIQEYNFDIIAITEIFPKYSTELDYNSTEWAVPGYNTFTPSEIVFTKRGCVIYIKNHFNVFQIHREKLQFIEHVSVGVKCGKEYLLVSCTYRSPISNCEKSLKEQEVILMNETVNNIKFKYILHMGDFNYKEENWDSNTTRAGMNYVSTKFLNLEEDSFLFRHVKKATRYRGEDAPSILDLIFTNENDVVDELEHGAPLGK